MPKAERSLQSFLDEFPVFEETDRGKLICTLTKHELPISEIAKYVQTKKFLDRWNTHDVLTKYAEHFQDLGMGQSLVACLLTKRSVAKNGISLRNHVKTPRFLAALVKAEEEKVAKEAEEKAAAEKEAAEALEAAAKADDTNEKMDVSVENDDKEGESSPDENAVPTEQIDEEEDENDEEEAEDDEKTSEEDEPPKPAPKQQESAAKKNRRLPKASRSTPSSAQRNGAGGDAKNGGGAVNKRKIAEVAHSKAKQAPKKKANRAK